WTSLPERLDQKHVVQARIFGVLPERIHESASGRHRYDRHASRWGPRSEAAKIFADRGPRASWNRQTRRTATTRRGLQRRSPQPLSRNGVEHKLRPSVNYFASRFQPDA